ncbi:MAG TPA: hypothetical protein VGD69_06965 [Herpetosiphonaceae bacterium]
MEDIVVDRLDRAVGEWQHQAADHQEQEYIIHIVRINPGGAVLSALVRAVIEISGDCI